MSTETQELKAGRELDCIIAGKVMGLKKPHQAQFDPTVWIHSGMFTVPHYSTVIGDAWEVVEKMRGAGYNFGVQTANDEGEIEAEFWKDDESPDTPRADTAPLAICLAALRSVEVQS